MNNINSIQNCTVFKTKVKLIEDLSEFEKIIFLTLPIFVSIFGITGNIFLLIFFKDDNKIEFISKFLLISHIIIQIIGGFFLLASIPFSYLASYDYKEFSLKKKIIFEEYIYGPSVLVFFGLTTYIICINSFLLVLVAFDRCLKVFYPIKSKIKKVKFLLLILLSISVISSFIIAFYEGRDCLQSYCLISIIYTCIIFTNTILLITFYSLILYKLVKIKRSVSSTNSQNQQRQRNLNIKGLYNLHYY